MDDEELEWPDLDTIEVPPREVQIETTDSRVDSRPGSPFLDELEATVYDEEATATSPESNTGPNTPHHVVQNNESQSAESLRQRVEDASRAIRDLRAAFGPNLWYQVVPLPQDEASKLDKARAATKWSRAAFVLFRGKVLFGSMQHADFGEVKTFLFTEKAWSELHLPTCPSGVIKVEPIFALIFDEKYSAKSYDVYGHRIGVCVRAALIDAGYSDGAGFKNRLPSNKTMLRTIDRNLKAAADPTSSINRNKQAPLVINLTEEDAQTATANPDEICTNEPRKRSHDPSSPLSTPDIASKRPRLTGTKLTGDKFNHPSTTRFLPIALAAPKEVLYPSPSTDLFGSAPGTGAGNCFEQPLPLHARVIQTTLHTRIRSLEKANADLTTRVSELDARLSKAEEHGAELRTRSSRADEHLRREAMKFDEQFEMQTQIKDEERAKVVKERDEVIKEREESIKERDATIQEQCVKIQEQDATIKARDEHILTLTTKTNGSQTRFDTMQHTVDRLKERNHDLRAENEELLVQIEILEQGKNGNKDREKVASQAKIEALGRENDALRKRNTQLIDERLKMLDEKMDEEEDVWEVEEA
ncbi:hypothetical protein FB567DRAFT_595239 [Paraphoma chrysanthemicola]|uniref:Uncharacterized protein n=1 Tax=Paraphoma chrysanthemicola TaxID=798071 RepID=A0A8K0VVK3_9PLEO|nr:hypothetical protein FB567DRAFT_595239 [Paraphoma chrysanthemicola]